MLRHGITNGVVKALGIPISAIRKKKKRIGELACTQRMCGLSFVGHRARVSHSAHKGLLSGMRYDDVVALNDPGLK